MNLELTDLLAALDSSSELEFHFKLWELNNFNDPGFSNDLGGLIPWKKASISMARAKATPEKAAHWNELVRAAPENLVEAKGYLFEIVRGMTDENS
jgi:hypothetical protein